MEKTEKKEQGYVVFVALAVVALLLVLVAGLVKSVKNENWFSHQEKDSLLSLQIAESGLNYYMWYLNHNPTDYQDGTGEAGPYTHDFEDTYGNVIGRFVLEITPPADGSTIANVRATGITARDTSPERTLEAQIGVTSLAKYAFLTASDVWIGSTETVDGKMHSNGGIRFDGTCNDLITSFKETYTCLPMHGCNNLTKPGVWGAGGPTSFWQVGLSEIDFDQISGDLSDLEDLAVANGIWIDTSNKYGYHLILRSNNTATAADDTVDVYKVTKVYTHTGWTVEDGYKNYGDDIQTESFLQSYNMPANGVIYIDDKVWVEGATSSRVVIAAAHFPESSSTYRSIILHDDLQYYQEDGNSVIALIAQGDVRASYYAPNDLEVDAVLLAQRGKVIRPEYGGSIKNSIRIYGSIISSQVWTWSWVDGNDNIVDGYRYTTSVYDPHLLYSPPPYFPTTGQYEILKWEEVLPQ
ncbi:hypothetical protein AUK40_02545 [Candidatus Wirthbacteria bacterium CG2_30_54_11]|uniref:Uncharacterized protein n=1 Tax=Candidatus Wirthbacteria bacterium CG2_30_54_11 TaxID=1817892 RepID=A0A1J5ITS5_9BACT|nr:MAG: hypothetical protein AUK40_02545 [Candidatus Wirthbacteria bacterium CG2_30_54_11]